MAFVIPVVEHWLEQEIAQWVKIWMQPCPNTRFEVFQKY